MITLAAAKLIAGKEISLNPFPDNDSLIIIDELIMEKPYAWIFHYTSKKYWETGDMHYALGGNSPIFVSKKTGQVSIYPTGLDITTMLDQYEEENTAWTLSLSPDQHLDSKNLLLLKNTLGWTQEQLAAFKKSESLDLDAGGARRLSAIGMRLAENTIKTNLALTPGK